MTLTAAGSPYTGSSTTISGGVTVTAEPGATVKLSGSLTSKGTLDVNGTSEQPVLFTSSKDTAAGQWTGIVLQAGAGASDLSHAEVRYGKTGIAVGGGISPTIANSTVRDNSLTGISAVAGSTQIRATTLVRNPSGILVSGEGNPVIAENTIEDCTGYGISQTISEKQTGQVHIHDNVVERCGSSSKASIYVFAGDFNSHLTGLTLAGNTVADGKGRAIDYYTNPLDDTVPADIDENTITGNASNAVWVAGKLTESATWENHGFVIVPRGGYNFKVGEGATLTFGPGLVVKPFQENAQITVEGELIAEGTPSEPITFTSIKDDSVGGDTNMDGSATLPAPGDYTGIVYSNANGAEFDYVAFHFAQTAVDIKYLNSMWIGHSDFIGNEAAIKVAETAENDPQLESLSCVPPYLSFVVSADNWYGTAGLPTPNIDVSEFLEPELPEEYGSLFEQGVSLAAEIASLYPAGDTIPFKIYSCPVLGIPPIPVTPVLITSIPPTPWFS
jgi:hypothetical protein